MTNEVGAYVTLVFLALLVGMWARIALNYFQKLGGTKEERTYYLLLVVAQVTASMAWAVLLFATEDTLPLIGAGLIGYIARYLYQKTEEKEFEAPVGAVRRIHKEVQELQKQGQEPRMFIAAAAPPPGWGEDKGPK